MTDYVVGSPAFFNEDAKFFKDVYIYGKLYYDFEDKGVVEIFNDAYFKGDVNIDGNLDVGILTVRKRLDVGIGGTVLRAIADLQGLPFTTGKVGIGSTSPKQTLDVIGTAIVSQTVGIGGTILPQQALDVSGSVKIDKNIYDSVNVPGKNGYELVRDERGIRWIPLISDPLPGVPGIPEEGVFILNEFVPLDAAGDRDSIFAASLLPTTSGIQNIGSNTKKWNSIYANQIYVPGGVIESSSAEFSTIKVSGISTFTNGPVLVGAATSTGTASQRLQVTGGAYVSGNLGIGTTNPSSNLHVIGNARITGVLTVGTAPLTFDGVNNIIKIGTGITLSENGSANYSGIVTATTFVGALTGTATSTTNIPNLTGDITSVNKATTLATVNSNVGTFGDTGAIPTITVNAKGLITGVSTVAPNNGALTLAVSGTGLSGSASFTANQSGSSSFTVTSNATNANTPSAIVARDASGNFSAGTITANSITIAGDGSALYGPNSTWAQYLRVGGNGNADTTNASVVTTNGNLHIDAKTGAFATYINYYKGTGGVNFGNGASATVGSVDSSGNSSFRTIASTVATGTAPLTVASTTQVSNLNASYLQGYQVSSSATGNTIVLRDGNGDDFRRYGFGSYFNSSDDVSAGTLTYLMGKFGDNYYRSATAAKVATFISGQTMNISGSSTSCSGNAATASSVINTVAGTGSIELVRGNMADNDQFRILVGGTATNAGYVEIATADDGTEPIYVRQYTGVFSSLTRTATLLDGSGNTSFPGTVSGTNITTGGNVTGSSASCSGNSATATLLKTVNTTSTSASAWNPQSLTYQAWGQSFFNSNISADSGDLTMWLRASQYTAGGTELCMIVDGDYYAGTGAYKVLHAGNYNSYAPTLTGTGASGSWNINVTGSSASCSGNSATATNLSTGRTNWSTNGTISAVVGQLSWKNYGNAHTIFDASASTSPDGGAVNNTNSQVAWTSTYPTLMGWNGANTYGVRVDSARISDSTSGSSASCSGNAATATTATNQSGGTVSATTGSFSSTLTVGGAIVRSAAGVGYLSGNYSSSESTSTSGAIYTIGGSYVPASTTLGNMYGIGYGYAGNGGIGNPGGVGSSIWGMYVASAGTARIFLDSDNGVSYATGSHRSPIFYDSNNTAYYTDPASTSNLNGLTVAATITGSISGTASGLPTYYIGGQQTNPQTYFGQSVGLRVAMTAIPSFWADTLWINGYAGGDVLQMCALHTLRNGTPRMYISAQASNATSYGTTYEFFTTYNAPFDGLTSKASGTGTYTTSGDFRAPIFYDSNNTAYYTDPASTSILYQTRTYVLANDTNGNWNTGFQNTPVSSYNFHGDISSGGPSGSWWFYESMRHSNGSNYWGTQIAWGWEDNANRLFQRNVTANTFSAWVEYLNTSQREFAGYLQMAASMRAPIFYDSNNTGYYTDPASTSILNTIGFNGTSANAFGSYWAGGAGYPAYQFAGGNSRFGFSSTSGVVDVYADGNFYATDSSYLVHHTGNAPRAAFSNLMYYQGFTLDANTMSDNATGFTYSVNAPYTGPVVRFSTGGGYDLWLNSPYGGNGYGLAFRTRNGDAGSINSWQYPAVYGVNVNGGGALYSTIYYDQNNTGYYTDPASTSILNTLQTAGQVVIGGSFTNNSYNSAPGARLMFGGGDAGAQAGYYVGTNLNNYGGNYTKLDLAWHTGIRMGAQAGYGGIRFFSNETLATQIFSVGETDTHVRVTNNLYVQGGTVGYPAFTSYTERNLATWYQAEDNLFVSVSWGGPYTNDFAIYAGPSTSTYYTVGRYGDDINANTKWSTTTFIIKKGAYFYAVSEASYGFRSWPLS